MDANMGADMDARLSAEIVVVEDAPALAEAAARRLVKRVSGKDRAAVALTGGSSPQGLYRLLAEDPWRGEVPWQRVHWFIGDDRFVPETDPLSNMGTARRLFLDRVRAPRQNIHPMATDANDPEDAARLYEDELKAFYGAERLDPARPLFDMVLMGLGGDGHTASLFPNSPALNETQRWALGIAKAGMEPFVPRVTLTFPALASTREMLFLIDSADKRAILEPRVIRRRPPGPPRLCRRRPGLARRPRRGAGALSMAATTPPDNVAVLVVMGVSGSGKSTIAAMLAHRLHWIYEDGDWLHPKANIEKMHHGEPLDDADRWPWLHAIADWIDATRKSGEHGVVACSALKRAYRDILVGERQDVRLVFLQGDRDLIAQRCRRTRRSFHAARLARQPV